MKFSHSLKFNSVPEWRPHYINYGALKKLSYALEKEVRHRVAEPTGRLYQPSLRP